MVTSRLGRVIALGSLLVGAHNGGAQDPAWRVEPYLPRPTPAQLNAIATHTGLTLAVGEGGVAVVSTDAGSTWSLSPTGTGSLRGIAFIDRATAVAVGLRGAITRTADGGRSWAPVRSPVSSALRAVAFLPNGVGIAIGDDGVVLRTEDRGLSWVRRDVRQTSALRAVTFSSPTNVIALGDDGVVLLSRNSGLSWDRRPSGTNSALRGVTFLDALTGVAVGGDDRRWRPAQVVLRTTDGGVTWRAVRRVSDGRLYGVSVVGPRTLVAVGENGTVLNSGDGGSTWTAKVAGHAWLSAVAAVDGARALAVGSYGALWRTADGGSTWASVQVGPVDDIRSIAIPAPNVLVAAAGMTMLRSDSGGRLVASRMIPPSKAMITRVAFGTPRIGLGVTVAGQIYRTTDGGVSWRREIGTAPSPTVAVTFGDEHRAVVAGSFHDSTAMLTSSDAGITWSKVPSGGSMAYGVAAFGSQLVLAVGSGASVLRTGDGGRTWHYMRHGLTRTLLLGVAFPDSMTAIVVGNDGTVLRSADAGRTWALMTPVTSMHLTAVSFVDARRGAAVGFGGALLLTDDGGRTWRPVPTSVTNMLFTVAWRGPDELIAAGEGGVVLRVVRATTATPVAAAGTNPNLTTNGARHD